MSVGSEVSHTVWIAPKDGESYQVSTRPINLKTMTTFRLHIIADKKVEERVQVLLDALELTKKDYEVVEGLTLSWDIEYVNFDNLVWETYFGTSKGIDRGYISKENRRVKRQHGERFASVIYAVDPVNWGAPGIGGWNLGRFYSGMSAQIVRVYANLSPNTQVLQMEIAHCLNEQVYQELGIKLKDELGVGDWDFKVVHGLHPDYEAFKYQPVFRKIADLLLRTFQKREAKFLSELKVKISLLTKVVSLVRTLIILLRAKPSVIHEDELNIKVD